jgi:UDP-glucose 4-epimerase
MSHHEIRRVLVTGGAGFIGSHTVDLLLERGFEVAVVDNFAPYAGGRRENVPDGVPLFEVDISTAAFEQAIAAWRPDGIIHLGAQPSVKVSTDEPLTDLQVNGAGIIRLLRAAEAAGVRNIVFASSGATYGTVEQMPVDEATPQQPESPYGMTKLLGEWYLRSWRERGVHSTILRYGNVYGPRQDPHGEAGVVAIFARRMLDRQPLRIDWDGEQQKDYVYVGDVARANVDALLMSRDETFCIASGAGTSVNAIYRALADELGYDVPIVRAPKRPGDIYRTWFDCSHAARVLGWRAEVGFAQGIRRTLAFFRESMNHAEPPSR